MSDLYGHHTVAPASVTGGTDVAGAKFGAVVAVGDFNNDGFDDEAVGAPDDQVNGEASGAVYVFSGSAGGPGTGIRLTQVNIKAGDEAGDRFGAALAVGDFNDDGFDDLAVGIPGEAVGSVSKAGAIAVFLGGAGGLSSGRWLDQTTGGGVNEAGDGFGSALAAGDLDGDGIDDLAIGTPGEAPHGGTVHGGSVFVYAGSLSGVVKGWSVTQEDGAGTTEAGDQFGAAVAIGDVTRQGLADLVVGAPGEAPGTAPATSGAVYVLTRLSPQTTQGIRLFQSDAGAKNEAGDQMGAAVAIGDFDHDGFADIAVGVPGETPDTAPASGSIVVFPGTLSGTDAAYWVQESGAGETLTAGDRFGSSLAARDVDGDGFADLLVGAPGKTYGSAAGAGAAFLFPGRPRKTGTTTSLTVGRRITQTDVGNTNESGDAFGSAVGLGDVNGDGKVDGLIGSAGDAPAGQPASGTAVDLSAVAGPPASTVPIDQSTALAAMQVVPVDAPVGTLEYAYTDNIGRLVYGHQTDPNNFSSVQWTTVSGLEAFTGTPALAQQADGKLHLAAHNISGAVWTDVQTSNNPVTWEPWTNDGGAFASPVTLARNPDGSLVAFVVDGTGVLWALPEIGVNRGYAGWITLGVGGLTGAPVAVTTSAGVQVFATDTSGDIKTMLYNDRMISGCTGLGGDGLGTPSVVVLPGSRLHVFARAADGSILTQAQDSTGHFPGAWTTVGTFTSAGVPSALLNPTTGTLEVVARGTDGAIYNTGETAAGSGVWRGWKAATVAGDLAATDATAFAFTTGTTTTWGFVFRRADGVVRAYTAGSFASDTANAVHSAPVTTIAALGTHPGQMFSGHTLPAPHAR